jgi:hypothetical protein
VKPIDWMPLLPIRGSMLLRADCTADLHSVIDTFAPLTNDTYLRDAHAALT